MASWQFIRARNNISTCAWPRELAVWPAVRGGVNQKGPNMQLFWLVSAPYSQFPKPLSHDAFFTACAGLHGSRGVAGPHSHSWRRTRTGMTTSPPSQPSAHSYASTSFVETSVVKGRPPKSSQMEATIIPMQLSMEFFAIDNINVGAPRFSSREQQRPICDLEMVAPSLCSVSG